MKIKFITILNNDYLTMTENCIESLSRLSGDWPELTCCCVDEKAYNTMKQKYSACAPWFDHTENDLSVSPTAGFRTGIWNEIVQTKFRVINHYLNNNDVVIITDGDIVYVDPRWYEMAIQAVNTNELVMMNDLDSDDKLGNRCSGFMAIRSTDVTKDLFREDVKIKPKSGDQVYINRYIQTNEIGVSTLPLKHFPNGKLVRNNSDVDYDPYLLHFNYIKKFQHKRGAMIKSGNWLI